MTAAQKRITWGVCLLVGLSLLMAAGLTFLAVPMAEDLGLSDNIVEDVLATPSAAALVMVFSAGMLGDRFGARRTLASASVAFSAGAGILAIAGSAWMVQLGLAVCAAAAVTVLIVGVSLLQQATGGGPAQVSAFTSFGMVFPLAFLVFPVATARLLEVSTWRLIPLLWILAGLAMLAISVFVLEAGQRSESVGEWVTPLVAGAAFAAGARALAEIDDLRSDPMLIGASLAICVVAAAACLLLVRRAPNASFTTEPIRGQQLPILLLALALVSLSGLLTYVSIALEYLYDLSAYDAALAVIPAQIGAILGAKFMAGWAIGRMGGVNAARILMIALAVASLPMLLLRIDTPLWFLATVATVFSFVWMALLTVLNAEIMGRAPQTHTGAVSSFRTAASSLGAAAGVGILGAIVITSLPISGDSTALTAEELADLTNSLRLDGLLASLIAIAGWAVLRRVQPQPSEVPATTTAR